MRPADMSRFLSLLAFVAVLPCAVLAEDPTLGPTAAGQSVADALREFANSDIALVPAGLLKSVERPEEPLSVLAMPGDGVVVLKLTGAQIRKALERSVAAFPQSSVGFLQLSGIEATFKRNAPANARVQSVNVGSSRLDDAKTYTVAMPVSLQRGQLGYANLWEDSSTISRRFDKTTLADIVKGRRIGSFVARWSPQG